MLFKKIVFLTIVVAIIHSISIPLTPLQARCMIGYTYDEDQNLKMDVTLPPIPDQKPSENYQISIYNTQTHETSYETISNGVFRKEIPMDKSVIYRFCFKIMTNRQIGTVLIEYNSEIKFNRHGQKPEVPENLLKVDDLKQTFNDAVEMEELVKNYKEHQQNKVNYQQTQYYEHLENTSKLLTISYVEIFVIVVTGIYQFFTVRKFLIDKQYL